MRCPINLECPTQNCPNQYQCYDTSLAWELPFYRTNEGLFVKTSYRTRWQKQAHNSMVGDMLYCPLPSGDYQPIWDGGEQESLIKMRIQDSLIESGWCAAIPLPVPNQVVVESEESFENVF